MNTPRTESEIISNHKKHSGCVVSAEFARKLENELQVAAQDKARLDWLESLPFATSLIQDKGTTKADSISIRSQLDKAMSKG